MNDEAEERRFRQAIIDSHDAVWAVARYIHSRGGWEVKIAPLAIRPSFEDRRLHGDNGDIHVRFAGVEEWTRIEVKRRSFDFTGPEDFPYPTFYLERRNRMGTHGPADTYFVVSQSLTHAGIIKGATFDSWLGPTTFFDRARGHEANCYEVPNALVRFVRLRKTDDARSVG